MALRTTIYSCLAAQSLIQRDKELRRGDRELAVVALVLHHGDRRWNASTRLSDLFRDSAPDTYRAVGRLLPDAQTMDLLGPATDRDRAFRREDRRADAGSAHGPAAAGRSL